MPEKQKNPFVDRLLNRWTSPACLPVVSAVRSAAVATGMTRKRAFHTFVVGAPRSGTTSLAKVFERSYRAKHEPEPDRITEQIILHPDPARRGTSFKKWLSVKDKRLWLEMESTHVNVYVIDELLELFPEATFILPVRDCFTWADSEINKNIATKMDFWHRFIDFRYLGNRTREELEFKPEEDRLKELGRFPIADYFRHWQWHNQHVIETVPAERLFILRTVDIKDRAGELADFLGIDAATLDLEKQRSNRLEDRPFKLFEDLPAGFLTREMQAHCKPVMQRFFPEIERSEQARR